MCVIDGNMTHRSLTNLKSDYLSKTIKLTCLIQELLARIPYVLVSDDIFQLKPRLMKPYAGKTLSQDKQLYTYRLTFEGTQNN